ncbi:MAG: thiamine pyrophosphate-binding protein [Lachnospiraceae bacterium]|nr:thiamine pyrophosphate-binding protein [Lachnospiraceae bacterium]
MKKKVSDIVADFLVSKGIEDVFTVTGGGAMHLNDSLGHHEKLHCIYNHHEQGSAIAAEAYARYSGRIAAVCVTSGPGGTNAITGVLGGYLDSVPMLVISGQVKRATTVRSTDLPLRQLGDQEFDIVKSVSNMTKYAVMVTDPEEIVYHLEKAYFLATNGRKGPAWIDIPLDVQGAYVETDDLYGYDGRDDDETENPVYDRAFTERILEKINAAKRPLILAGEGIYFGNAHKEFLETIDTLKIPVVTAWNANDLIPDDSPFFAGRPGSVGTRGGNFAVQSADLLLVLGCRMNIRIISYNEHNFAKNAYKIMVDIDETELQKPTVKVDMPIHADVKDVLKDLIVHAREKTADHSKWCKWCRDINARYPACKKEYLENGRPLNPYAFIKRLSEYLSEGDAVIVGNGAACVQTFQAFEVKRDQRVFTNSGCAAMGYGFPAAVGVSVCRKDKRTVCIDGDGSFMMNLQELQTAVYNRLDLKIFILNNNGYHSIRQTQTNLFKPPLVGVCADNGISFPDFERLSYGFGIPFFRVDSLDGMKKEVLDGIFATEGPVITEAVVDEKQNFEPKLSSRMTEDGKMVSPDIDDMFPFLPREEYEAVHAEAQNL